MTKAWSVWFRISSLLFILILILNTYLLFIGYDMLAFILFMLIGMNFILALYYPFYSEIWKDQNDCIISYNIYSFYRGVLYLVHQRLSESPEIIQVCNAIGD